MSNLLLFYRFYTPLHLGSGTTLGYIDLPIEREAHTAFPVLTSSSIKGVFRANYTNHAEESKVEELFGSGDYEGGIVFVDGKILFYPVKSTKEVFVWVTCPFVINRFKIDTELFGIALNIEKVSIPDVGLACVLNDELLVNNKLFIEGFSLRKYNYPVNFTWVKEVGLDADISKIVVVHDNLFSYLVKYTTEVNARIKINQETGVVEKGALWYEELVPAETIFYGFVVERKTHCIKQFKADFLDVWGKYYQFGGDETLGRGIAMISSFPKED